jgi:hypothetical protein
MEVMLITQYRSGYGDVTKPYGAADEVPEAEETPDALEKFLHDSHLRGVGVNPEKLHAATAQLNERVAALYRKIATQARTKTPAPAEIPLEKRAKGVAKIIRTEFPASGRCVIAELDEHNAVIRTYLETDGGR